MNWLIASDKDGAFFRWADEDDLVATLNQVIEQESQEDDKLMARKQRGERAHRTELWPTHRQSFVQAAFIAPAVFRHSLATDSLFNQVLCFEFLVFGLQRFCSFPDRGFKTSMACLILARVISRPKIAMVSNRGVALFSLKSP